MPIPYYEVVGKAQKKFSLMRAFHNGFPTVLYHAFGKPLPKSEKVTMFTSNIFPPLAVVWHHMVRKMYGDRVDIFIYDCSGYLNPQEVPTAKVQKYVNAMHPTKIDVFLKKSASNRKIVWICDDDVFPLDPRGLDLLEREFENDRTATVSFRPRTYWHYEVGGQSYEPSGSYCIALNREIFVDREHLNAQPANGNNHPSHIGKPMSRYDTLDKSNEILLEKGYRCAIMPQEERDAYFAGYDGTSIAALILHWFQTSEDVLTYLREPDDAAWAGNNLPRTTNALLAASSVCALYKEVTGHEYVIASLPSREALEEICHQKKEFLTEGRTFDDVNIITEKLRSCL